MRSESSVLVVVDIQERLCPVMADPRRVLFGASVLVRGARRLNIPILATEQNTKGLGPTMIDLRELIDPTEISEKMHFSCADDPVFMDRFSALGRTQAVICGIESHVCVLQTALGLKARGVETFVIEDACSSRRPESVAASMARLRAAGVGVATVEMALFEWLNKAGTDAFRELVRLIK